MATGRISKTTLGLRFMQNARSKQESAAVAEAAPTKDDGEWQVSQEVRDAWGLGTSSSTTQAISHETSYIPFIYTSEESGQPRGRRTFNQFGKEPEKEPPATEDTQMAETDKDEVKAPKGKIKSISSATQRSQSGPSKDKPKSVKSARASIFDNPGVGIDLDRVKNASASDIPPDSKLERKEFLKPADVPDPRPSPRGQALSDSVLKETDSEIISGARAKPKRPHPGSEDTEGTKKKRKKKKTLEQSLE